MRRPGTILLLILTATPALLAESRFERAQRHAWDGKRSQARALCEAILAESPSHHDARILLARTYAWDGKHERAREELLTVLASKPDYVDAYRALADTELWDDDDARALVVVEQGLSVAPDDLELRYRQLQALEQLGRHEQARELASALGSDYPDDTRLPRIERRLRLKAIRWWASLGHRYEELEQFDDPWHETSFTLKRRQNWGSLFARLRHARRFDRSGEQFELDAYPKLPGRQYLYLNLGAGESPFPDLRGGAELFKNFAEGWEGSVGARYLDFGSSDVLIWTGSVSKYIADYWFSLRPFVTDKELGTSASWGLTVRRYLSADSWVGTTVGLGSKPAPGIDVGGQVRLASSKFGLSGEFRLSDLWQLRTDIGYREKDIDADGDRGSVSGSVSVTRAF